jgi:hypothetical protein
MSFRQIYGLLSASEATASPWGRSRATGARAKGKAFEKSIAKLLPQAAHGRWFSFRDAYGPGYCQPDLILFFPQGMVLLECKLTDCVDAQAQMRKLYVPVLEYCYGKRPVCVEVMKNLRSDSAPVSFTLEDAIISGRWHVPRATQPTIGALNFRKACQTLPSRLFYT